ncbi:MAG: TonB-dependent receptor [Betaproteobacteria bacterium]
MKFQRKKLAGALAYALGAGGAFVLATTPAQAADIKVEVTGSLIKRVESEGALPVQIITRTDIEQSGASNMSQLIQSIPVMQGFTTQGDSVGGGGAGFTGAGLRGQGETRTLVLLNGKRLAPSGTQALTGAQAAVNLNNIPIVAIERIEILTDGASSVYGSDAIGGVVNFITRRDLSYGEITAGINVPDGNVGKEVSFSAVKGFGELEKDGFNLLLAASRNKRDPLKATDREYAKSGLYNFSEGGREYQFQLGSPSPIPGNIVVGGNLISPWRSTHNGECATRTFLLDGACYYDFTTQLEIYPEQQIDNAYASFTKKLGRDHQLSIDWIYSQSTTTSRLAPPPGSFVINDTNPLWAQVLQAAAYEGLPAPTGKVTARYRVADVGQRTTEDISTANHGSIELKGTLANWDYSTSYTRSESEYDSNLTGGWVQLKPFVAALNSGLVNPFLLPGQQTPEAQALLNKSIIQGRFDGGKTTLDYFEAKASRGLFAMGGGDFVLALGASYMKEKFESLPSSLAQGFDDQGNPDTRFGDTSAVIPYSSNRSSVGVFAEALIPITKTLEVTPSVRFDDYSDFGSTTNYKLTVRWQPLPQLLVRGSAGSGFKAPTVPQLNAAPQPFGVTGGTYSCKDDPRLQAVATQLGAVCPAGGGAAQFDVIAGGNKLLKPEESKQWTVGARYEPIPQVSLGIDYWSIKIDNTIGQIDEDTVFGDPQKYLQSFTTFTDPATGEILLANLAGNVNLGKSETHGIDLDLVYRQQFSFGQVRSQFLGTYILKNEYEVIPGDGFFNDVGKFINGAPTFRFKAKWVNTLTTGSFNHALTVNYLSGYQDDPTEVLDVASGEYVVVERKVKPFYTFDWQTRWQFAKQWTLTAGALNIFNKAPPLSITQNGGGQMVGYDARFYDSRDRLLYANLAFRF